MSLGSELTRLKNDQKKSKSNFERMKMYMKRKSTKKGIDSDQSSGGADSDTKNNKDYGLGQLI